MIAVCYCVIAAVDFRLLAGRAGAIKKLVCTLLGLIKATLLASDKSRCIVCSKCTKSTRGSICWCLVGEPLAAALLCFPSFGANFVVG